MSEKPIPDAELDEALGGASQIRRIEAVDPKKESVVITPDGAQLVTPQMAELELRKHEAKEQATMLINSGAVPRSFCDRDGAPMMPMICLAVMSGINMGFDAAHSLKIFYPVDNKLTIYGDGMQAIVLKSGLLKSGKEWFEGEPGTDDYKAISVFRRRKVDWDCREEYSIGMAKAAGLWGKRGPWTNHPLRMLQWRARTWSLRALFADVLSGFEAYTEHLDIRDYEREREAFSAASIREGKTRTEQVQEALGITPESEEETPVG